MHPEAEVLHQLPEYNNFQRLRRKHRHLQKDLHGDNYLHADQGREPYSK